MSTPKNSRPFAYHTWGRKIGIDWDPTVADWPLAIFVARSLITPRQIACLRRQCPEALRNLTDALVGAARQAADEHECGRRFLTLVE